jgi:2-iminobutanoate/2-iminopropanoate deaminase
MKISVFLIHLACLTAIPLFGQTVKPKAPAPPFQTVPAEKAPKKMGPYTHGVRAGGLIYVSGQTAADPKTGLLVEGGIKEQTRQVLRNVQAVVEAGGSSLDRVVKVTVFLTDWKYYKEMNEAYAEFFDPNHQPARSTIQGARSPEGHLLAMEAIALADGAAETGK